MHVFGKDTANFVILFATNCFKKKAANPIVIGRPPAVSCNSRQNYQVITWVAAS